jgi:hypothetical protein
MAAGCIDSKDVDRVSAEIRHKEEFPSGVEKSLVGMRSVLLTHIRPWGSHVEGLELKGRSVRCVGAGYQRQLVGCEGGGSGF